MDLIDPQLQRFCCNISVVTGFIHGFWTPFFWDSPKKLFFIQKTHCRQFNRFEMTRFDDDQVSQIRRGIVVAKDGLFVLKCGICDSSTVDALMAWDCRQGKGFTFSL
ncbi:hypothetical protein RHMOL_Rhmol08G0109500 [Rhododendron molle]|uniref:Uncharacterized protein n=1 Tax=Rhododendron molle TaxID=49168 RepID=A0ACC0MNG6_RHOML|nr:hypothetical protein RHMOL_Rhmol08G0109500 [Rhododendron molle]